MAQTKIVKLTTRSSFRDFADTLRTRTPFKTSGALSGEVPAYGPATGRLDAQYHGSVSRADYVVYSYGTPIAWHIPCRCNGMSFIVNRWVFTGECHCPNGGSGWVVPDDKYSVTTSRHQSKIATAVSVLS